MELISLGQNDLRADALRIARFEMNIIFARLSESLRRLFGMAELCMQQAEKFPTVRAIPLPLQTR